MLFPQIAFRWLDPQRMLEGDRRIKKQVVDLSDSWDNPFATRSRPAVSGQLGFDQETIQRFTTCARLRSHTHFHPEGDASRQLLQSTFAPSIPVNRRVFELRACACLTSATFPAPHPTRLHGSDTSSSTDAPSSRCRHPWPRMVRWLVHNTSGKYSRFLSLVESHRPEPMKRTLTY
jgi:hypothetical protein